MFGKIRKQAQNQADQERKSAKPQATKFEKKITKFEEKLKGSKFRLLNEFLYTVSSADAASHFQQNPQEFRIYHEGYSSQISKWPENPAQNIIKLLTQSPEFLEKQLIVYDLGCGEGVIQEHFSAYPASNVKLIKSFDLHAAKPFIIKADISKLPCGNESCNVVIYSLSLMGTNYLDFLAEGFRVLKPRGYFIIAEVKSRMPSIDAFIALINGMGCQILKRDEHNSHFVLMIFKKTQNICQFNGTLNQKRVQQILGRRDPTIKEWSDLAQNLLLPCLYKRR